MNVIDIHEHIGLSDDEFALIDVPARETFPAWLERALPGAGGGNWRRMLLPPVFYTTIDGVEDVRRLNDLMTAAGERVDAGVVGAFGVVEPHHGKASFEELERLAAGSLKGVVFSPRAQGVYGDTPQIIDLVSLAAERHLAVMFHATPHFGSEALWRIRHVAERCPKARLIALGALAAYEQAEALMATSHHPPNLGYDTAGFVDVRQLAPVAARIGAERLLFGSGAHDARAAELSRGRWRLIADAGLPDGLRDKILFENAERFLERADQP